VPRLDAGRPRASLRLCGFPPPSSGAIAIGQILGILGQTPAAAAPLQDGLPSADWLHAYTEAARLAFADRAQYLGDPDFVAAPGGRWISLLDAAYLRQRASLIGTAQSMKTAKPGTPPGAVTSWAPMADQPEYGTSHISIVDGQGKALAMTTTIEDAFGARQMVRGFLLNNELTDFSLRPERRRRQAGGQPGGAGQAAPLVDVAHAGVRQGHRPAADERRQPGRRVDHPLHRQDAVRAPNSGA
jgi:gamma-glutamyltranspeptidase